MGMRSTLQSPIRGALYVQVDRYQMEAFISNFTVNFFTKSILDAT